jgi:hypothetical protein
MSTKNMMGYCFVITKWQNFKRWSIPNIIKDVENETKIVNYHSHIGDPLDNN